MVAIENNAARSRCSIRDVKYTFVDTCFGSHHVQFDAKDRAWTSGAGPLAGWVDMKIFDETGDAAKAQGWSPFILDTNGNGQRDEYTEPNQPMDAAKDMRVTGGSGTYAVMPNPADGSIWYTVGVFAGRGEVVGLVQLERARIGQRPQTALADQLLVDAAEATAVRRVHGYAECGRFAVHRPAGGDDEIGEGDQALCVDGCIGDDHRRQSERAH